MTNNDSFAKVSKLLSGKIVSILGAIPFIR